MLRVLMWFVVAAASCGNAMAQPFPSRPVRLIVTYAPGGSSDLMARVLGQKLTELWGQQVIVESKPGAAGSIGTEFAARQPADGYTFLIGNIQPVSVNPLLSKVSYSVDKDFVPVSLISTGPNVLVVNAAWQVKSLDEILDYARANPGKLSYGTSGPGSISHLAGEMMKNLTRVNVVEIPYKGSALTDPGPARPADPVHLFRRAAGDGAHPQRQAARVVHHRRAAFRAAGGASDLRCLGAGARGAQLVGRDAARGNAEARPRRATRRTSSRRCRTRS